MEVVYALYHISCWFHSDCDSDIVGYLHVGQYSLEFVFDITFDDFGFVTFNLLIFCLLMSVFAFDNTKKPFGACHGAYPQMLLHVIVFCQHRPRR